MENERVVVHTLNHGNLQKVKAKSCSFNLTFRVSKRSSS